MSVNAFLIVVILVLIGCTVLGGVKGFVHTIFTMFSLFIIILLTGMLSPYVSDYIHNHTEIPERVKRSVEEKIDLKSKIKSGAETSSEKLIDSMDLPEQLKDVIKEKGQQTGSAYTDEAANKLADGIYDRLTEIIISAIAYLFTFAVIGVIVLIAGILLDIVAKLPGIKQANAVLGAIIGFAQGYLIVSLMYIAATALTATKIGAGVMSMVDENKILTWFFDNNPVVNIVFNMFK